MTYDGKETIVINPPSGRSDGDVSCKRGFGVVM
jgi:hypothetical protein